MAGALAASSYLRKKLSISLPGIALRRTILLAAMRPGLRKELVPMKLKGTKTRYPGVYRIDKRTYRIQAKYRDPRTGKERWIQRLLHGVSAQQAAAERKRLLGEAMTEAVGIPDQVKIGDYAKSWLESKSLHVDLATVERYA